MQDVILVLNAGSSSIKFSVFAVQPDDLELRLRGQLEGLFTAPHFAAQDAAGQALSERQWPEGRHLGHDGAVTHLFQFLREFKDEYRLIAVGHRVVHGGMDFAQPVRTNGEVLDRLAKLIPLAPLHQPHNLAPIRAIADMAPQIPQIACFDTAFHRDQPELAQMFALPPPGGPWSATWATGRACARWRPAAASPAPWASPPWTVCPWAPAAAISIREWCST